MARALGAVPHVEYNWAIESGLYDFDGVPLDAVQSATPVTWPKMLDVARPGEVVGELSVSASAATGLRAGTTIVVGGAITYFQRTVPDSSIRVTVSSNSVALVTSWP